MTQVLIAENDADVRTVIAEVVREAGYTVTEVGTPNAALHALLASGQPHVVLLDTHLDGERLAPELPPLDGDVLASVLLLEMAYEGALHRHTFVLLTTDSVFRLPPALKRLRTKLALPVVSMPFAVEGLLHAVGRAAERLSSQAAAEPEPRETARSMSPEGGEQSGPGSAERAQQGKQGKQGK